MISCTCSKNGGTYFVFFYLPQAVPPYSKKISKAQKLKLKQEKLQRVIMFFIYNSSFFFSLFATLLNTLLVQKCIYVFHYSSLKCYTVCPIRSRLKVFINLLVEIFFPPKNNMNERESKCVCRCFIIIERNISLFFENIYKCSMYQKTWPAHGFLCMG